MTVFCVGQAVLDFKNECILYSMRRILAPVLFKHFAPDGIGFGLLDTTHSSSEAALKQTY